MHEQRAVSAPGLRGRGSRGSAELWPPLTVTVRSHTGVTCPHTPSSKSKSPPLPLGKGILGGILERALHFSFAGPRAEPGTGWQGHFDSGTFPPSSLRLQIPVCSGSSSGFVRKSQMGELCDPRGTAWPRLGCQRQERAYPREG